MTDKITLELTLDELKELDKNLYYCEETWSICDKIRNAYPKSPVVEAYKDWYGEYPPTSPDADKRDIARWHGFQAGYNASYGEQVAEEPKKESMSLYKRFENESAYGQLYYDDAIKVVKDFLLDEGVIEDESGEYITFTLQKSLLDTHNDCS